jgi:hypothetical protein
MKKKITVAGYIFVCMVFLLSSMSFGTIIGGPGPSGFGNDDGSAVYSYGNSILSFQLLDLLGDAGFPTYFGFYFADPSDPSPDLIGIFEADDVGSGQAAQVDFVNHQVIDIDAGSIQYDFSAIPSTGDIGFFLAADLSSIGASPFLLYSESIRNGGTDVMAAFPNLIDPASYLLAFELFNSDNNDFVTIGVEIVSGITPSDTINPVPEPATIILLGAGLSGAGYFIRRKNKSI